MTSIKHLSSDEKVAYLIKPILKTLQDAGGQLTRSDIKDRIAESDDQIAEYAEQQKISKKTGNTYSEFEFKFNFAIKDLMFLGYLTYENSSPITLTQKGLYLDISKLDELNEIVIAAKPYWEKISKSKKNKVAEVKETEESEAATPAADRVLEEFKNKFMTAISKMSPRKFEAFSRKLLTNMGVEFTEKGVQISNDGGIDGLGYHTDLNDFRTTRVVIQCKRYNTAPVSEPEINQFLGAMNKNKADYGVFITNSRFTKEARKAAREGSPITLIDGNDLVKLVIKYELYITPITTYVLDDFYNSDEL